jgi:hypothetical protein
MATMSSSVIQDGFADVALVVIISGMERSRNRHLNGQNEHLTVSDSGSFKMVPH